MSQYTLNEKGQHFVGQFVQEKGKDGLNIESFFNDAENAANESFYREITPTIEIGVQLSYDGRPYVLTLDEEWFDMKEDKKS